MMRRSFGVGMGGGRGIIEGAIRGGIGGGASPEPPYSTTTTVNNRNQYQPVNTALSLSSNTLNHSREDSDWECIHDDDAVNHDFVFGSVPSKDEVHHALSSLQQVVDDVSFSHEYGIKEDKINKSGSDKLDWREPSLELCNSIRSHLEVPTCSRVYDAFHLMQTDPSVQRMVISLSSDKAVWDAVMNNEVVRELGESIPEQDKVSIWEDDDDVVVDGCNPVKQVLRWMFVNTKDKVVEIVERITKIVNQLVHQPNKEEKPNRDQTADDSFQEKLRTSFLLSIMVLFIVVVTRATRSA